MCKLWGQQHRDRVSRLAGQSPSYHKQYSGLQSSHRSSAQKDRKSIPRYAYTTDPRVYPARDSLSRGLASTPHIRIYPVLCTHSNSEFRPCSLMAKWPSATTLMGRRRAPRLSVKIQVSEISMASRQDRLSVARLRPTRLVH